VVRTFDVDARQVDGEIVHYLVMEYVEGQSLRELLRELGSVPEAMCREIARQVADGLAAIHALRIVHRDIKPENILITTDHEVRIMDLGVAKVLESTITVAHAGQFAGSMLYGAPEQFGAGGVGPSADLYSLGVTLYELATGDHPFRRDNQAAVIDAHLHHSPASAAERNPELTPFFSELIARLVAKNPEDRFGSAQLLHLAMEEAEQSAWWIATESELQTIEESRPRIPVRRETALHGRTALLERLRATWGGVREGRGGIVLLEGEAGIGKSRVLDEFVRDLPSGEKHILYGSYPPSGGLGGISDAIVGKFGDAALADAVRPYLESTPLLVPGFTSLVRQSGASTDGEAISWGAFMAVCVHLMRSLAEERPLLWMIDDLHFAPQESRDLVFALARAVVGHRALIVVTSRPGLPEDELAHLSRLEHFERFTLQRLGAREVVELLRGALRSESLANKLGGVIAYKSDGVPFFIFEMIRGLEQGQFIERRPDGSYVQSQVVENIEVPSAVLDLIQGRLRDLDKEQREILDVGSVQGLRFDPSLVADVLEMKRVHVLQHLAQIERQTGLIRGSVGGVEFDQHQIHEVLYVTLLPELRAEYHRLLADAYAARISGDPTDADSAFIASHQLRGSEPERGLPYLLPALDHLTRNYRNEALVELAGRALELGNKLDVRQRVDILLRQASRLGLLGRREQQRRALDSATAYADESGDAVLQTRTRVALAGHLMNTSELKEAVDAAQRAISLASDGDCRARAEGALGRALLQLSRFAEARPHLVRQLELARGDPAGEADACGDLGLLEKSVGNYADARPHFERQMALALESEDRHAEATASGNLGTICKVVGQFHGCPDEARALFAESLEISREIGNRLGEARASGHLGLIAKGAGRYEEAVTCFERSRALAHEVGDVHGVMIAAGNLGNVEFDLGRYEQALARFEEWRETATKIGDRQAEVVALGNLGNALQALGRLEDALDRFEQARTSARAIGDREGEAIARADLGILRTQLGDPGRAKDLLEQSLVIVRELGLPRSEAYALHGLGAVAEQEGDSETAARRLSAARDIYHAIHFAAGGAETELALGKLDAQSEQGRKHLELALKTAQQLDLPTVFVIAACTLGTADAAQLLAQHEDRMSLRSRMEAHFQLGDEHLEQAHALLTELRAGAPETHRTSIVENVPLHREIAHAWDVR
jgi:tetratricopeptide (TPR) repeat protein